MRQIAKKLCLFAGLAVLPALALADGGAGPYLAGRAAMASNDFDDAARYYTRALARDPSNLALMENAAIAFGAAGQMDRAITIARRLEAAQPGNLIAGPVLMAEAVAKGQFDRASQFLDSEAIAPLIRETSMAWVKAGAGKMSEALEDFRALAEQDGLRDFGQYHLALALASVGDMEGADAVLSNGTAPTLMSAKRPLLLHAQVLAQLDRAQDALPGLNDFLVYESDASVVAMRDAIAAGAPVPFDAVSGPADGVAEVFLGVAQALAGEADDMLTLAYSRLAEFLNPGLADAVLLSSVMLESMGQFDLATESYDRISRDDPAYYSAALGRANALRRSEREEDAAAVLVELTQEFPSFPSGHASLGDTFRRMERYDDASKAYDTAIALLEGTEAEDWFLYYVRGITHEREDRWPLAEADFRKALELNPNHPSVLNYLGYSFVEMQINLDEALQMIETAVNLRPRDGYITDSLGWVYYRLGRYEEAVDWMEAATQLMPVDPIINDHLGDVYWAVGRKREARFQWMRALSFEPEEEDANRIRRKLEVGLDVVLSEEGADPLHPENDG